MERKCLSLFIWTKCAKIRLFSPLYYFPSNFLSFLKNDLPSSMFALEKSKCRTFISMTCVFVGRETTFQLLSSKMLKYILLNFAGKLIQSFEKRSKKIGRSLVDTSSSKNAKYLTMWYLRLGNIVIRNN